MLLVPQMKSTLLLPPKISFPYLLPLFQTLPRTLSSLQLLYPLKTPLSLYNTLTATKNYKAILYFLWSTMLL